MDLVERLTRGLGAAVRAAVTAAGVDRPFVVRVMSGDPADPTGVTLPGFVEIGGEQFRDRMRAFSSIDGESFVVLWKGEETGETARVSLADHCDGDTLEACREVNSALSFDRDFDAPDKQRALAAVDEASDRLTAELNQPGVFSATADPFLVSVELGDPYGGSDWDQRARRVLGRDRVEAFLASVASAVGHGTAAEFDPAGARFDRAEIERWLTARGVLQARAIAYEHAVTGLRLSPSRHASSRIGGPGLLPAGSEWPRDSGGRPLSFLAGIDLREFPDSGGLPQAGWMLFFADLNDEGEALGFIGEPTPNEEGANARMLWVEPGDDPVGASPPPDLPDDPYVRLAEERVAPQPQLTLPDGYDSARGLGLDAVQAEAYNEIAGDLRYVQGRTDDWVLGAVTGVQGHEVDPGSLLLLHIASIEWMDAGAIQFRIPESALAERDWSQVWAEGDSC